MQRSPYHADGCISKSLRVLRVLRALFTSKSTGRIVWDTALASADPAPSPIRCDTAAELPALLAHVLAVVDAGDYFRWWVEHEGIELDLAFTIDKAGAAYRIRRPGGEMAGLFAEFADAIQHGVALYHVVANARRQDGR